MVRLAVNDGPAALLSSDVHSASSSVVNSRPSTRAQREACTGRDQRRLKLVLFRSRAMPMNTPVAELSSLPSPASCSASDAVCSISSCCGSISSISRGGIRKRFVGSATSSMVKPAYGDVSSPSSRNQTLSPAPCQALGEVGGVASSPPRTRS